MFRLWAVYNSLSNLLVGLVLFLTGFNLSSLDVDIKFHLKVYDHGDSFQPLHLKVKKALFDYVIVFGGYCWSPNLTRLTGLYIVSCSQEPHCATVSHNRCFCKP